MNRAIVLIIILAFNFSLSHSQESHWHGVSADLSRGDGYAFVYFPTGWSAEIILDKIGAKSIRAHWFKPGKW